MPQAKHVPQSQRDLKAQLTGRVLRYTRAAYRTGGWMHKDTFLYVVEVDLDRQQLVMLGVPPRRDGSFALPRNGQREELPIVRLPLRLLHCVRQTTLAERAGDRYAALPPTVLTMAATASENGGTHGRTARH